MPRRIAHVLRLSLLIALLLALGSAAMLFAVITHVESAGRQVEHAQAALDEIHTVRHESLRSGLELRRFAATPNPESLPRVRAGAERATQAARQLLDLSADDPSQRQHAGQIQSALAAQLRQELATADALERNGRAAPQPALAARAGTDATRELQQELDDAEQGARTLLRQRLELQAESFAQLKLLLAGVAVAGVLFMLWVLRYAGQPTSQGRKPALSDQADALRDPLTGLLNRRGLELQFAAPSDEPRDDAGPLAVLAFDLDGFKAVNNRYGRAAGDQVLQEVAQRLRDFSRDSDVVARMGSDEFVVVLRGVSLRSDAGAVAQRIRAGVMAPMQLGTAVARMGVCLGVALLHQDGPDMAALLQAADEQVRAAQREATRQTGLGMQFLEPSEL
jgi:diguanylate cyclase (GGDEF)-like protein